MHVHRHSRHDQFGEEGARKSDRPISKAMTITVGVITPASPNTAIFTTPVTMEMAASVAITAVPSSPGGEKKRQQHDFGAARAADQQAPAGRGRGETLFAQTVSEMSESAAQRHGGDQGRADHDGRAPAGQQCVEVSAKHAGRHRGDKRDQRAGVCSALSRNTDDAGAVGEHRRNGDDRHHWLGTDHRHQHKRHQRPGAIAGDSAERRPRRPSSTTTRATSRSEMLGGRIKI